MKKAKLTLSILLITLSSLVKGQSCNTEKGIDLSQNGGAFSGLPPRDQGQLGTCYAHAGSDLLSSYLGIGRINIYQTAMANDTSMSGGWPGDVINSFARLEWACTDTSLFKNLFPSQSTNIIGDLQDTFTGFPVFYTAHAFEDDGIQRQKRIAQMASELASLKVKPYGILKFEEEGLNNFLNYQKQITVLKVKIQNVEKQKSWFDKSSTTKDQNQQISSMETQIVQLTKKAEVEHKKYTDNLNHLNSGGNFLDRYTETDAAEIVYYLIKKQYSHFVDVMTRYGIEENAPSLEKFIVDRVEYNPNPKIKYSYAGQMYPYKILKKIISISCPEKDKAKIPSNIFADVMKKSENSNQAIQNKIDHLLSASKQGVGLAINTTILTGTKGDDHAVNIIGCRTRSGEGLEYYIQNSWGADCKYYKEKLKSKCQGGRIWVPASEILNGMSEIEWVRSK